MNLKNISDKLLLKDTFSLASEERAILARLLWHLKEIDRRKLYADLKCGSLFEYCVKVLKYSEGQASRRVSACRLLRELPQIAEKVESGELNLMQLNMAKQFFQEEKIIDPHQKIQTLNDIAGMTLKNTENELNKKKKNPPPEVVKVILKKETMEYIKQAQALKPHKDLDTIITLVCKEAIEVWTPSVKRHSSLVETSTRYVPVQLKTHIWERDKGKCRNCGSTYALEIDHIKPFARGGKTREENLQLLCRNCNQRKGLVEFSSKKHLTKY